MRRRRAKSLAEFFQGKHAPKQADIAAELGISEGHLSHLVNGNRQASLPLAVRISGLTGVPVEALVQTSSEVLAS